MTQEELQQAAEKEFPSLESFNAIINYTRSVWINGITSETAKRYWEEAMQSTINQQKAEIEELKKQLADNEKFVSESISEATYQTSQCISLQSKLTEANKRGEKLTGIIKQSLNIKNLWLPYSEQIASAHEGENVALHSMYVSMLDAISEYEASKVK